MLKNTVQVAGPETLSHGHREAITCSSPHYVLGSSMEGPYPKESEQILFGMGCFWGAERLFWQKKGVYTTAAGYAGGHLVFPRYQEVCSGATGHTEVVLIVYLPAELSLIELLTIFWESHDPTQGNRQGNDHGTQYRSAIYWNTVQQKKEIELSYLMYSRALASKKFGSVTTEIKELSTFYFAEDYHQQYLAKNPGGYCGLKGTGVCI